MALQLLLGIVLGIAMSVLAWRFGALSLNGGLAAAVIGGLIFGLGGLAWAALLLIFFTTSSVLSYAFARQKVSVLEKYSKGARRDWGQVLANGLLGAGFVVVHALCPDQTWVWIGYAGAIAAVTADTWGTELGVLDPHPPRLVTSWRLVERGTSGAVSLLGSMAALAGACLIAVITTLFTPWEFDTTGNLFAILLAVSIGGAAGAFLDSYLGSTVQALYYCPACDVSTEHYPIHTCGEHTQHQRGWRWMSNDIVNLFASIAGAGLSMGIWLVFGA